MMNQELQTVGHPPEVQDQDGTRRQLHVGLSWKSKNIFGRENDKY